VRSACSRNRRRNRASSSGVARLGEPCRCSTRSICPLRRRCEEIFNAQAWLTPNRSANSRRLPAFRSCASKIFRRKSSEYAFAMMFFIATESPSHYIHHREKCSKPLAVIAGPHTGIRAHINHLRVYGPKGWIILTVGAGDDGESSAAQEGVRNRGNSIAVWSIHDNGDIPPRWLFGGPKSAIRGARMTLNPAAKEVVVGGGTAIKTYYFPEIF
jgi:hypothetical protein